MSRAVVIGAQSIFIAWVAASWVTKQYPPRRNILSGIPAALSLAIFSRNCFTPADRESMEKEMM